MQAHPPRAARLSAHERTPLMLFGDNQQQAKPRMTLSRLRSKHYEEEFKAILDQYPLSKKQKAWLMLKALYITTSFLFLMPLIAKELIEDLVELEISGAKNKLDLIKYSMLGGSETAALFGIAPNVLELQAMKVQAAIDAGAIEPESEPVIFDPSYENNERSLVQQCFAKTPNCISAPFRFVKKHSHFLSHVVALYLPKAILGFASGGYVLLDAAETYEILKNPFILYATSSAVAHGVGVGFYKLEGLTAEAKSEEYGTFVEAVKATMKKIVYKQDQNKQWHRKSTLGVATTVYNASGIVGHGLVEAIFIGQVCKRTIAAMFASTAVWAGNQALANHYLANSETTLANICATALGPLIVLPDMMLEFGSVVEGGSSRSNIWRTFRLLQFIASSIYSAPTILGPIEFAEVLQGGHGHNPSMNNTESLMNMLSTHASMTMDLVSNNATMAASMVTQAASNSTVTMMEMLSMNNETMSPSNQDNDNPEQFDYLKWTMFIIGVIWFLPPAIKAYMVIFEQAIEMIQAYVAQGATAAADCTRGCLAKLSVHSRGRRDGYQDLERQKPSRDNDVAMGSRGGNKDKRRTIVLGDFGNEYQAQNAGQVEIGAAADALRLAKQQANGKNAKSNGLRK